MNTVPAAAPDLDLALIGNCAVSALVDRRAAVVWCCMPRFDGEPIFHALLDGGRPLDEASVLAVELEGFARSEQAYDPGTAVLRTRLYDGAGEGIEIVDFCPRFIQRDRAFRPAQLIRRVRPLVGHPRVRFIVQPRGAWGALEPTITRGSNHARFVLPSFTLRLNSNAPLTYVLDRTWFSLHSPVTLALGPDETMASGVEETARDFEELTTLYWRHWSRRLAVPLEWQDAVIRSAITLKLCQFDETGAIVAAMTTSIPEAPGTERNWDYRYCWLRDAFFVVRALNSLAEVGTMEDYLRWLNDVVRSARGGHIQPLYGIGLEKDLAEHRGARTARLPRDGAGAGRQPGFRTLPARRLRQHRARRGAGVLRPSPVPPCRPARLRRARADGRAGLAPPRPARRRHVGAEDARTRPHLVGADVLGGLRSARQDRRTGRSRARCRMALEGAMRSAPRSWPMPGATSVRRSSKASAGTISMPACC